MDIVFLGDSLTFGYGVHKEDSWVNRLCANCNLSYLNKGVNGDTTVGMLSRVWKDVINIEPRFCFILAGTNDFLMDRPYKTILENIVLLHKECEDNNIKTTILIPPFIDKNKSINLWSSYPDYNQINKSIINLKNELLNIFDKIKIIDLYSITEKAYFSGEDIYIDGIHLNEKGHMIIAEYIINKLKQKS
ncbi:GDSL-type esterase/lipase family protein [Clostridium sp. YIM B02551]|uniref:GDSL-type esterase/lipase family protein n=1 Tax=Clostridium sp. YIM B02551 TaxID=2910679 RepID=UPI001EEA9C7E|nr:GDSL-type esterase/lipase family protein [Clostridium sp. YIM B02551]